MKSFFTIGHSTHPWEEFLALLKAHKVNVLADVRTIPRSRRMPWFNQNQLKENLAKENIQYLHFPQLGGFRKPKENSINLGLRNKNFRGYADYMQTPLFEGALSYLFELIKSDTRLAIMCAEAVPWRCHRFLISDAAVARGYTVCHILSKNSLKEHELNPLAKINNEAQPASVFYPGKMAKT